MAFLKIELRIVFLGSYNKTFNLTFEHWHKTPTHHLRQKITQLTNSESVRTN